MKTSYTTDTTHELAQIINACYENLVVLHTHDNGQLDYFDVRSLCDIAKIRFEQHDDDYFVVFLDNNNKRELIISVDQLSDLVSEQTANFEYFINKSDAKKFLAYELSTGNIDSDTYNEFVHELSELKFSESRVFTSETTI